MEKSFFVKILGNAPIIRVLDFMLCEGRHFDYSLSEISKHSKVGWSTLHSFWNELVESKIVIQTRQIGRAKLYKLNMENPIVQELIVLDDKITEYFTKEMIKEELSEEEKKIPVPV